MRSAAWTGTALARSGNCCCSSEDPRVPIRQRSLEALDRDIGKGEIDRPLDVQLVVLVAATRVEDDGTRLFAHADELGLGEPVRLTMRRRRIGDAQVATHIDRGIGSRCGSGAKGPRRGGE